MDTTEYISLVCSVAIASNGIISWWESFYEPMIRKNNIKAYTALNIWISDCSTRLDCIQKKCQQQEEETCQRKEYFKAFWLNVKAKHCENKSKKLQELKIPKLDQEDIYTGARNIWIHLIKFFAFLFAIISIYLLVFSVQLSKMEIHNGYFAILFLPQTIAFVVVMWVYCDKIFPFKILKSLLFIDFIHAIRYEIFLLKSYFCEPGAEKLDGKLDSKFPDKG